MTASLRANTSLGYIDDSTHVAGEPDMDCLLLNLSKAPFDNLKVRQAAAMAISSAQYAKVIDEGVSPTSNGPFVTGSPYCRPHRLPRVRHRQGQAAGAGGPAARPGKPVTVTLDHTPDPNTTKIAEYLQQQLQTAGMQVTLSPIQQADDINTALLGTFEAIVWRQFGAVDPDLNYIFWSPTNINPVFSINMARNTDPSMQAALIKGRQSPNPADRAAAYQEVAKLMGSDIPYIWTDRTVWADRSPAQGAELQQSRPRRRAARPSA